jgi:cytochrome c oxidase subunit III
MSLSTSPKYYVPEPSIVMIPGSFALLALALGATLWFNGAAAGPWVCLVGFALLLFMVWRWFGQVIGESEGGKYNEQIDVGFRWGMSWFIFSEVMFFAAFFGALFYARTFSVPWLSDLDHKLLWPNFSGTWPTAGPNATDKFQAMGAWGIPALNTALLLASGVTLTIAHHALRAGHRASLNFWLFATIALGVTFLGFQAYEYIHAYSDLNLKLTSGIFGSTFYMLTGFHGFHVTLGAIMLTVIWFRCLRGHFKPDHHFAFEGVAWYWHFVDVVWLLLFILVYML